MDRDKVLDKIQKCLRLSKSSEPHEAAAALRQAQKLMRMHNVSEAEVAGMEFGYETVKVPIQVTKKVPLILSALIALVKRVFAVRPVLSQEVRLSDASWNVTYYGLKERVAVASYTHVVLHRAMEAAWREYLFMNPLLKGERGARAGFMLGWLEGVSDQVEAMVATEAEAAGTQLVVDAHCGKLVKTKTNSMNIDLGSFGDGATEGSRFKLHRPVGQEMQQLRHKK